MGTIELVMGFARAFKEAGGKVGRSSTRQSRPPTLGLLVIVFLRNLVSAYTERWLLVLGLIYVLVMLCALHGIVGVFQASLLSRLFRRAAS